MWSMGCAERDFNTKPKKKVCKKAKVRKTDSRLKLNKSSISSPPPAAAAAAGLSSSLYRLEGSYKIKNKPLWRVFSSKEFISAYVAMYN